MSLSTLVFVIVLAFVFHLSWMIIAIYLAFKWIPNGLDMVLYVFFGLLIYHRRYV